MTSLAFDRVTVHYRAKVAVEPFTETVRPGEWLCLIGPNGAGKSSILRAAAGLVAYGGSINVDGSPLALRSTRRRAELVAYVPQLPDLPTEMTGAEYVLLGRTRTSATSPRRAAGIATSSPTCCAGSSSTSSPTVSSARSAVVSVSGW